jgi:hypothetical protein
MMKETRRLAPMTKIGRLAKRGALLALFLVVWCFLVFWNISGGRLGGEGDCSGPGFHLHEVLAQTIADVDVTPLGCSAVRPDVVRIGDYLYLHIVQTKPSPQCFRLLKLDKDLRTIYAADVYSGRSMPTDARVSVDDKDQLWYSFETVDPERNPGNYLNLARYDVSSELNKPILKMFKQEVAVGYFARPPKLPMPGSELMDDPTPFFHNGNYCVMTKTFSSPHMFIRHFSEDFAEIQKTLLDLSTLGRFFLSPSVITVLGGEVFLIAGISNGPKHDPRSIARIVALPITHDLKVVRGTAKALTGSDEFASYVSAVRYSKGKVFLLHNVFTGKEDPKLAQQEHVGMLKIYKAESFDLLKSIMINKAIMPDNHMSMELLGDHLYIFYNTEDQKIMAKKFSLKELS